jgi:hypothetical protein
LIPRTAFRKEILKMYEGILVRPVYAFDAPVAHTNFVESSI